jgi:organic hydroperoxide reductase OsmC/OhrA
MDCRRFANGDHDPLPDDTLKPTRKIQSEAVLQISAFVRNAGQAHDVSVATAGSSKHLAVPAKAGGGGSSVNGGEFLMPALATCYCNDIYREAARLGVEVKAVEVEAVAQFEGVGLAATNIRYKACVDSSADCEQIQRLLQETAAVAEVHNTVRAGASVELVAWESRRTHP